MSDATLIQCTQAITTEVQAAFTANEFGAGLIASVDWSFATFDDLVKVADGLRVDLVPFKFEEAGQSSRTRIGYVSSVDAYVRKRFNDITDRQANAKNQIKRAEIARLVRLVQDIHERFIARRLPAMPSASWKSTVITNAYSRKHLREHAMFVGAIRFSYDTPEPMPEFT